MKNPSTQKNILSNNKGFSLMEVVIAASITVILGSIVTQSVISTQKMAVQMEKNLDFKIDSLLSDKIVIKDFRNVAPSLNQLAVKDDAGNPFFDFEPDRMSPFYIAQAKKTREFSIGVGLRTEFIMIIKDDRRGYSIFVDPVMAYDVGASPADISTPAVLVFQGFNKGNFLQVKNSLLLNPKELLVVDSSAFMPLSVANPRRKAAMFLGFPNNKGNVVNFKIPGGIFDPGIFTPSGVKIPVSTLDDFLRNLPPLGSVGSSVRILPVKIIKYEAICAEGKCNFYRSQVIDSSGVFGQKMLMNAEAKTMKIKRTDIATTIFNIEFIKPQKAYNKK